MHTADSPSQPRLPSGHRTPRWVYVLLIVAIAVPLVIVILHLLGVSFTHMP
jgi:hypothetical protein